MQLLPGSLLQKNNYFIVRINSLSRQLTIFLLWVSLSAPVSAQSPSFYHLGTAEGLSDNNVTYAQRDRNGILWIGTSEGLNSFDGNRISTYYMQQYPELADNGIDKVVIDGQNRIWLRTNTHYLTMLDEKRKFHRILVGDTSDARTISSVNYTKSRGIIVLKGRQHYFQQKNNPLAFEKASLPFDKELSGSGGFAYFTLNDKAIYYRNNELFLVDYRNLKLLLRLPLRGLIGAQLINDREMIAFTSRGDVFYRISVSEKKISREYRNIRDQHGEKLTGGMRHIARIDERRFAISSFFSGLYILDLEREMAWHWVHDPIDPRSLGGNNTSNVIYDSSGYLFITTQSSGLHYYNVNRTQAGTKTYFMDAAKNIFDGYILSVTTDDQSNVWLGAQDRLIRWNRKTGETVFVPLLLPNGTNISGRENIRVVGPDRSGHLWAGTSRYGVIVLDQRLQKIVHFSDSLQGTRPGLPSSWINALCNGNNGEMWVGTHRGVCIIDEREHTVKRLNAHPLLKTVSSITCTSLWKDKTGRMWIGTTEGAWCFDEAKNSLTRYSVAKGLAHNTVYAIEQDLLGNTYFATAGGLSILSADGKISNYNRSNGLRNDRCEGLQRDQNGYIWIGNLNCILRYDPRNKTFAVFEEGPGFNHAGFRTRSSHKSREGEMFWGSDKGLTYFFPEQMDLDGTPLHPSVNTLQAGNEEFRFTGKDELRFPFNTHSFVFTFSSGELSGDKKNQLRYRLTGFDPEWKTPATTGQAVYSRLPAGRYEFEMKASRDGINWYAAPYPVVLTIARPWWQQTWFRLACIVLGLLLCAGIYTYYRRRKKTREFRQTIDYFANSPYEHSSVEDILWDITRNCTSRLGFEDCVIYMPDAERKVLVQKAAFGPKNPGANQIANPIEIPFGKGIVGDVAQTGQPALVHDTSKDLRYIVDDERRFSELTVPIIHDGTVIGVIDSEHPRKRFFTQEHLSALQTIASLCAAKIARSAALDAMKKSREELMLLNVKMAETKFLNLRLQMNPHFLFNSLSAIQHLIVSQQTTKAYRYLTVFSNFLRSLLNFAEKNFIPLDEELKILKMYVELESLRFDESFTWEISADESLMQDEVLVPSLMVQPFAENAIWHGLLHKEGDKKLRIRFTNNSEDYLSCIVEDNGVGREKATEIRDQKISSRMHESKGIGIIRERLELLQQKTGKPASVEMEDLYDQNRKPSGTRVHIIIPYYNPEQS